MAALKQFYQGRWLLPRAFTANNRVEAIQPMYVPFWLFHAQVTATAAFRVEDDAVFETPDETLIETSIYHCDRTGTLAFPRIPVDGSQKMDDTYMESIEPFDYSEMVPFSPAYFAGYLADKYDIDAEAAVPRADERLSQSAFAILEETVDNHQRRTFEDGVVHKDEGTVEYAMAPVWILTTRYDGKPYTFMMNGQTGKMAGSLPYDKAKSYEYGAALAVVLVPVLYFLAKFVMIGSGLL